MSAPAGVGLFVIRATHERGVGVRPVGALRRISSSKISLRGGTDMLSAQTNSLGPAGMGRLQSLTGSIPVPRTRVCAVQSIFFGGLTSDVPDTCQIGRRLRPGLSDWHLRGRLAAALRPHYCTGSFSTRKLPVSACKLYSGACSSVYLLRTSTPRGQARVIAPSPPAPQTSGRYDPSSVQQSASSATPWRYSQQFHGI